MRADAISIAAGLILILVIAAAGCIEPPKAGGSSLLKPTASKTPSGIYNPINPGVTPTTPPQLYVTVVTPFEPVTQPVPVVTTQGYSVFPIPSPVPEDLTCLIYTTTQPYAYNASAFSFNLQNPPMYIDYSVSPQYITRTQLDDLRSSSQEGISFTSTDFSPDSFFLVTVRDKTTGEIYLKNGFGPAQGYSRNVEGTIKVLQNDNLIVEFSGNQVTATANIWVKPLGNFENIQNLTFSSCKYWNTPQNFLT
jgi:hypothetical protein